MTLSRTDPVDDLAFDGVETTARKLSVDIVNEVVGIYYGKWYPTEAETTKTREAAEVMLRRRIVESDQLLVEHCRTVEDVNRRLMERITGLNKALDRMTTLFNKERRQCPTTN